MSTHLTKPFTRKNISAKNAYELAYVSTRNDIEMLQDIIIKKDKTGRWCYLFAKDVRTADKKRLQEIVIERDQTGEWCYRFAKFVPKSNIETLQNADFEKNQNVM